MQAEAITTRFKEVQWRFHGFLAIIISDCSSDQIKRFQSILYALVDIIQLLSTLYHPQTNSTIEYINQEIQAVLRSIISFTQTDQPEHLTAYQLTLNNKKFNIINQSLNKLLNSFDIVLIQQIEILLISKYNPATYMRLFLSHLQKDEEQVQAAIAYY